MNNQISVLPEEAARCVEVRFDLTDTNEYCDGTLRFLRGQIYVSQNGEEPRRYALTGIRELVQRTYSGCSTVELTPENAAPDASDSILLCRFSMSRVNEVGEFCKVVNHYIETGEETEIPPDTIRVCPKCGRAYPKGLDVCLFCVDRGYVLRHTASLIKPYIGKLLFASLLITAASLLSAIVPVFNAKLVDEYLYNPAGLPADVAIKGVIATVTLIAVLKASSAVFRIISQRRANRISCALSDELRRLLYDKVQRLSLTSMAKKTSGDLMKRVTRDTEIVRSFITEQGLYALEKLISFIAVFVILLSVSPTLTLLVLAPVPVVILAIYRFWRIIRIRYERQWRCESRVNSVLHDIVKGIRVIKSFGTEKREVAKFDALCKRLCVVCIKNEQFWAMVFPYLTFLMGVGEFLVLYFGGRAVINGDMRVGQLLEFTLYLAYIYQPLRWISTLPRRLGEFTTSLIKIFEILDEKPESTEMAAPNAELTPGDIEFRNVRFGYKPYETVLKDINLLAKQGRMIGLVGHSGAGKSTLINLILRLYEPDSGVITVNGTDIRTIPQEKYRQKTAVVFQETFLFTGTVFDNIAYARPGAEPSEIIAAAKAANAHGFIMDLPDGYNTVIGENGHNLSGGERQRISIARAVLRNPEILILDEATSALDPETEQSIQDALSRLVKGRTTFAIAHRLATLKNADTLIVIEKGRITETGSHKELLAKNGIYAKLVMAQRQTSKLTK
ncbi:MAG: ABC transporter ATP-binding protein [Clostridia bacterium]|nr:ABC transporter ATP-binding protein [Clostridia bacterium]